MSAADKKKGAVFVENKNSFENIFYDDFPQQDDEHISLANSKSNSSIKSNRRHQQGVNTTSEDLMKETKKKEQFDQRNARLQNDLTKNVQRSVQIKQANESKTFGRLSEDIEEASSFLDSIDKTLKVHEENCRSKSRRQFEEWNTNIHGKIQSIINEKLNSTDSKELNKVKNTDFKKFLEVVNKKGALYRDIIIESEYDPLEPNRRAIKAAPGKLKDPTMTAIQMFEDENSMLDPEASKKSKSRRGKYTLPVELWASGKLEATPHGRFSKMMGAQAGSNRKMDSKVVFDDYNYETGKNILNSEMPKGKRQSHVAAAGNRVFPDSS